jgi:hypothetical protein
MKNEVPVNLFEVGSFYSITHLFEVRLLLQPCFKSGSCIKLVKMCVFVAALYGRDF